jgi:hypothetical protein
VVFLSTVTHRRRVGPSRAPAGGLPAGQMLGQTSQKLLEPPTTSSEAKSLPSFKGPHSAGHLRFLCPCPRHRTGEGSKPTAASVDSTYDVKPKPHLWSLHLINKKQPAQGLSRPVSPPPHPRSLSSHPQHPASGPQAPTLPAQSALWL